jgi:endonuclease III
MDKRIDKIIQILEKEYPSAKTELRFSTPFQLLVATILSAQTTDTTVNKITPSLFERYPDPGSMAEAPLYNIKQAIRSVNYYNNKAFNIKKLSQILVKEFKGETPDTMEDLIKLPGVARKTANVLLSQAFGKTEGIVVDTHVKRLSERLGLSKQKTPEKIEIDLMKNIPREKWISFPYALITHGRKVCNAKKPLCPICPLAKLCPYSDKTR